MNKKILLLVVLLCQISPAWSIGEFEHLYATSAGDLSPIADQIVAARTKPTLLSDDQKYIYLKSLEQNLQQIQKQHQQNPVFWFLTGLNQNSLAQARYVNLVNQKKTSMIDQDIDISNHSIARSRAYDNAIRLDTAEPYKLSSAIYATMSYGLSNRQKIKTYSRELEIGTASENESNEWFLHWAKIDALVHEKKLEEAQQALSELQALLAIKENGTEHYSAIVKQAKTQVIDAKQQQNQRQQKPQQEQTKSTPSQQKSEQGWIWKTWLLVTIGISGMGFIIFTSIYYYQTQRRKLIEKSSDD